MSTLLTPTVCPSCHGYGLLNQPEGHISCPTCAAHGAWLFTPENIQLFYALPETLSAEAEQLILTKKVGRYLWAISSSLVLAGSFAYLVTQNGLSFPSLFWQRGLVNFIFGLSGLSTCWVLAHWNQHHTSKLSLHDLKTALEAHTPPPDLNLAHYANHRLEEVIKLSSRTAHEMHSPVVDETLFLITLLSQPRMQSMLSRLELASDQLLSQLKQLVSITQGGGVQNMFIAPEVRMRILGAVEEALEHDFPYVDLEDVLLAYLKAPGQYEAIFKAFELTYPQVYAISRWYAGEQERLRQWQFWLERGRTRSSGYMNKAWTALPTRFLDQYSQDITRLAANGQVASVTVRDKEIEQILQVLGRTNKNNVLLVGEPGVGKNSIQGAIALRMIEENVPEVLKDKRLVSMDLGALLSSGDSAEQNMEKVLEEVEHAGNVILSIPDIHTLVGTGTGALDAASLLSNALSRGYIQIMSTATYADYHRYVESNASLTSLLEIVEIKEVTEEQAIEILEEEAPQIEHTQKVMITYPAIAASVKLAKRYFPDKALPFSAIGLLDEAASKAKLTNHGWVTRQAVEEIVEKKTDIPIQEANQQEADKLLHLEDELHKRIIGQHEAVVAVANALRRARAGLHNNQRPISSFLFVGPTGVGKTETAKALAEVYFGREGKMVRLDMSEFQDNRAVYKLIGAPAADSDSYTEGGALTQPIREHPFSLILLDELEKAYPEVLNLFLQLLDDGRLTENTGRTVFFNNSIIVATSNAASQEILKLAEQKLSDDELHKQVIRLLQTHFKPEFLNRFDAIIPFHALTAAEIDQVVVLMLQEVIQKSAQQELTISFTPEAIAKIGKLGFDPEYGARPLRRVIQDKVEGMLAKKILDHSILPGQALQIDAEMIV